MEIEATRLAGAVWYPKSKIQNLKSKIQNPDPLIGLILFLIGLYAYTATLAPTVLEGDAALYEYTPYVLGVTYPTGYPLYILLGKLWLTLFPFGELAWRMNLFSALCSAAALPLLYGATRRLLAPHISFANNPHPNPLPRGEGIKISVLFLALFRERIEVRVKSAWISKNGFLCDLCVLCGYSFRTTISY